MEKAVEKGVKLKGLKVQRKLTFRSEWKIKSNTQSKWVGMLFQEQLPN